MDKASHSILDYRELLLAYDVEFDGLLGACPPQYLMADSHD